ncbi:FtsZ-interacting cell division protein ZipA [Stenotrophomonas sp. AN71]|uniref:hypothetical protein n=1 Tax=Stenotrophomonas sp. AN71 TaxID=3156253 RepID=UPI003D23D0BC
MNITSEQNKNDRSNSFADVKQPVQQGPVDGDEQGGKEPGKQGQQQQQDDKDRGQPKPGQDQKSGPGGDPRR